jgi:hypothetical protein
MSRCQDVPFADEIAATEAVFKLDLNNPRNAHSPVSLYLFWCIVESLGVLFCQGDWGCVPAQHGSALAPVVRLLVARSPLPGLISLRDNPEVSVRSRGSISATSTVRDLIETGLS